MGRIITFYSYKGGVGRSMAVANVAVALARWDFKVLVVDWDLEAPGLEVFYRDYLDSLAVAQSEGVIDLLHEFSNSPLTQTRDMNWSDLVLKARFPDVAEPISLLTSGKRGDSYFPKVRSFDLVLSTTKMVDIL